MKTKTILIISVVMLVMLLDMISVKADAPPPLKIIEVGVHKTESGIFSRGGAGGYFRSYLTNYSWEVGNRSYKFNVTTTYIDDLENYENISGYDVYVISGI